jgi:hypothetical protein
MIKIAKNISLHLTKFFTLSLLLIPAYLHAETFKQCNQHLDQLAKARKYQVPEYKGKFAKNVILDHQTRYFRSHFRDALATEPKVDLAGHYVLTAWGCGSPCYGLGWVDLKTGKAFMGPNYSYSSETSPDNQIIIKDRPESQEQIDITPWLTPTAYQVTANGKFKQLYLCEFERK